MESIAIGLSSSELQTKLGAIESLVGRLEKGKRGCILEATNNETKKKIYSSSVNLLKDVNTKVVHPAFGIVSALIDDPAFQNLKAITFDILLVKFGDAKPQVRSRASEVMAKLVMSHGDAAGCDKLLSPVNLGHRNGRVREHLLHTLTLLIEVHDCNISSKVDVIKKVASLLNDSQPTVRQVAVETLGGLYKVYGNKVLTTQLEGCGVRPQVIQQVQQYGFQHGASALALASSSSSTASPSSSSRNFMSSATTIATSLSSSLEDVPLARASPNTDSVQCPLSADVDTSGYIGKYAPAAYLNLLFEAPPKDFKIKVEPIRLYSEKELEKVMAEVAKGLENTDDWEVRLKSLATLQGIALGDGMEYSIFTSLVRSIHALLIAQISDLRSTLCKEACRTVAVLARTMSSSFNEIVLLFIPSLMKQSSVKTQIMSSAAYRALFTLITASSSGSHPKALSIFFEHVGNKNTMVSTRRTSIECICLATALWPSEYLKREAVSLQNAVKTGATDADKEVRRVARQLFWVLHADPAFTNDAENLYKNLEAATQKHIQQEKTASFDGDLKQLLSKPLPPPDRIMPIYFTLPRPDVNAGANTARRPSVLSSESNSKLHEGMNRSSSSQVSRSSIGASISDVTNQKNAVDQRAMSGTRGRRASIGVGVPAPLASADDSMLPSRSSISSAPSRNRMSMAPQRRQLVQTLVPPPAQPTEIKDQPEAPSSSAAPASTAAMTARAPLKLQDIDTDADTAVDMGAKGSNEQLQSTNTAAVEETSAVVSSKLSLLRQSVSGPQRIARPAKQEGDVTTTTSVLFKSTPQKNAASDVAKRQAAPSVTSNTMSLDEMKSLSEDSHWENRVMGMERLHAKLVSLDEASRTQGSDFSASQVNALDTVLDALVARLDDAHHKVTIACIGSLSICIDKFAYYTGPKLTMFLPALFSRLADRRPHIREKSNTLLNVVRSAYDACTLVAALGPRMSEVPANIRAAVLQFLAVIVPHAGQYFEVGHNTSSFLSRLSNALGASGGSKPSVALTSAGNRLTELVYKAAPNVVVAQVAVMPLQHQIVLKKALESSVPDFEYQLLAEAAKAGSNYQKQRQQKLCSTSVKTVVTEPAVANHTGTMEQTIPKVETETVPPTPPVTSLGDIMKLSSSTTPILLEDGFCCD